MCSHSSPPFRAALLERRARVVETLLAGAAALGVVAFGVFVVSLDIDAGHVALSAVAAVVALTGTVVAPRRQAKGLAAASLVASLVVVAEAGWYDVGELADGWAGTSLLVGAAGLFAAGVLLRVRWETPRRLGLASGAAAVIAFVASFVAIDVLAPDHPELASRLWWALGTTLVALVCLAVAGWALREPRLRNLATTLWSLGLVALLAAELALTDGGSLFAVAVAVTAAAAAVVAQRSREPRLWIAAALAPRGGRPRRRRRPDAAGASPDGQLESRLGRGRARRGRSRDRRARPHRLDTTVAGSSPAPRASRSTLPP